MSNKDQTDNLFSDGDSLFDNGDSLFSDDDPLFDDDPLLLAENDKDEPLETITGTWKILVADDDEDVHVVTQMALTGFTYQNKALKLLHAYSAEEARQILHNHPDIVFILLDVVMESRDAGLGLVKYVRQELNNPFARIILRTGQPGYAPERTVIEQYEIDDYKLKTELTADKLFTAIITGLRTYNTLITLESLRHNLETEVSARTEELTETNKKLQTEINERKQAEVKTLTSLKQIERAKKEWEATVDSLTEFVCLLDDQLRVVRANQTLERWDLGETIDIKGKKLHRIFHPDCTDPTCYLETFPRQVWTTLDETQSAKIEVEDSQLKRHFHLQIRPVNNHATLIIRDITERKKTEQELTEHRNHLEKLVQERTTQLKELLATLEERVQKRTQALETSAAISRQLTAILDISELLEYVVNRIQTEFNFYHVHLYVIETETNELVMFEGSGEVGRKLKKEDHRLQMGQGIVGQVASIGKFRVINDVNQSNQFFRNPLLPDTNSELAIPLRKGEQVLGVLDVQSEQIDRFIPADISLLHSIANQTAIAIDNARLLAERQATIAKLQEVDRAKSQFITVMSHELRTPLNAINGFSELLLLGLSGELPESAKEDIQLIHESGEHLLALINDILDISQIESGQVQLTPQSLDVQELIDEVLASTKLHIKEKPIKIEVIISDSLRPIWADHTRLKQVLLNLVGNAIKFTEKGVITIQVSLEENVRSTVNNKVYFSIKDTGIGIPANKVELIFQSFQQVDMSDSRRYGGTGLGLKICQQLVELHGGKIGVKSSEGVGSEFWFTVPVVPN
ncbi:ATP-binding protein [Anaerolineales bacterium HSG25]|nr:ATP-binding protein [Anaerolineales bacterium HSG25]